MRWIFPSLLMCAWLCETALAHDLRYRIGEGKAVSVKVYFPGDREFSFESYEIYRLGEEIPFQVGRTDRYGRVVFLPDRPGDWRIKVFSEDGHGLDASLTTGLGGAIEGAGGPGLPRSVSILVGVALIFGLFGLVNLFAPRSRP